MELSFVPEPKAELRSVTIGSNGIATPYGAREEITLDSVSGYTTVTAMFGSAPEYSITYVLNGGENSPENPEKYTKGSSFIFEPKVTTATGFSGFPMLKSPVPAPPGEERKAQQQD